MTRMVRLSLEIANHIRVIAPREIVMLMTRNSW